MSDTQLELDEGRWMEENDMVTCEDCNCTEHKDDCTKFQDMWFCEDCIKKLVKCCRCGAQEAEWNTWNTKSYGVLCECCYGDMGRPK